VRFFWLSAVKDLRRYRRDATALGLWFLLPLIMAGMIGLVFGRGDAKTQGLLLIADEDSGLAGTFLRESISRGPLGPMLGIQQVARAEGRQRLAHGDGSALLIIPKGYDRAVMHDEPAHWTLVTNPEQLLMPRVVREVASANVEAAFYLQRIAGSELRAMEDGPHWRTAFRDVGRAASGVNTYLDPPRIVLKTTVIGDASVRRRPIAEVLFPGTVLLVILMMSAGLSQEIWKEKRAGAVRRVAGTPAGMHAFLAGKLTATFAVLLVAIGISFAAERLVFDIPMRACALAVAWSGCAGVVVYGGLLVMQLLLASERTASTVSAMTMVPLAMLGGSMFPIEEMPENFAHFARYTPNGWMLVTLRSILSAPVARAELARDFTLLLVSGALLFGLAGRLLNRRFARRGIL
jgi:ABC-2 type transport system permease protein